MEVGGEEMGLMREWVEGRWGGGGGAGEEMGRWRWRVEVGSEGALHVLIKY